MKKILLLFAVVTLGSCKSEKQEKFDSSNVDMKWSYGDYKDISSIVDTTLYIPLETHSDGLFGQIASVLIKNDRIYVYDRAQANALLVFDITGKFLFKVGRRGAGPGEYTLLWTFDVDDKYIYFYSTSQKKLAVYDLEGNYVEERKLPFHISDMAILDNGDFMFTHHYNLDSPEREGKYRVSITDNKFNVKKELFKINDSDSNLGKDKYFMGYSDKIAYQTYVQDTLVVFDAKTGDYKTYSMDFGENTVPEDKKQKTADFLRSGNYTFFFQETPFFVGDYLVGIVSTEGKIKHFVMNTKTNDTYFANKSSDKGEFYKYMNYPIAEYDGYVVSIISGRFYNKMIENGLTKAPADLEEKIKVEDNTTLVLYKLKQ